MDPMTLMALLQGGSALGSGIAGFFGNKNKNNPANAANAELDKIPGQTNPYFQPYIDAGRNALGKITDEYGNLVDDPNATYNKLAQGYKESPGYQFKLKQALGAGQNASAAGGMLGTPQDQQTQMGIAEGLSSEDFEKYMGHMYDLYSKGLAGEQGINDQGFGAGTDYASMLANITAQKGQNNAGGQDWKNRQNAANWGNVFSGAGAIYGGLNQPGQPTPGTQVGSWR